MKKNRIKNLREVEKMTQVELAQKLETTQQRMSQIENGSVEPNLSETAKLLKLFSCSFEELFELGEENDSRKYSGILITYTPLEEHIDPNYNYLIYGESSRKAVHIKNVLKDNSSKDNQGMYLFFNTKINDKRYITAYFSIDKVLHRGEDDEEISKLPECSAKLNDTLIITGERNNSKILIHPLLLDKALALSLYSLGFQEAEFVEEEKELSCISNKTRMHRLLSEADTKILIDKCKNRG